MTRRLLLSYVSITLVVLAVLVLPLGAGYADRARAALLAGVERDAHAVADLVTADLAAGREPGLDRVLADYAARGGRIVVVTRDGRSVGDSDLIGEPSRDFSTRPEIAAALSGTRQEGVRFSETLGHKLMYVAIPVVSGGEVLGAVRISYPTAELDKRVTRYWVRLGGLSALVLAAVVVLGFALARGVTRPVQELDRVARSLSRGQLDARADARSGVPELRSLAGTVNSMAERLTRLVGSQRLFVADAAHQLRTPLTALRLRLETLHLPADQQPKLDAALAETARLGRLVDSLLALARADAAAAAAVPVDAAAVAADRVEAWQGAAAERGVRLELESGEGPAAAALAVPGALEQILDNLVSNGIAVSPQGGAVTVRTGTRGPGLVSVAVLDAGPGLSEEDRARAFEPFWRGRDARPGSGFGLGLAIARRLAEAGGGTVELAPRAGGGTEAVVLLATSPQAISPSSNPD